MSRKRCYIIFLLLFSQIGWAQQDLTLYNLSGVPQANRVNPSVIPESKIVIGIPALSSVNANYNNHSFSVNDGFSFDGNTLVVDPEQLLRKLDEKNYIYNQIQDQWFVFGYKFNDNYLNISLSDKVILDFTFPKSLLELAIYGNAGVLGQRVSIADLNAFGAHYREMSLGYARKLDKWELGIHANLLFGLANVYTGKSDLGVYTDPETYDILVDGGLEVNTSGLNNIDDFGNYITNLRNLGFGVDLGATYHPSEQLEISTSILDLGTIFWKQDIETYSTNNKKFELNGIDINQYLDGSDIDVDSLVQEIQDSIVDVFTLDTLYDPYNSPLFPKWYVGGRYSLTDQHHLYATVNLQFFQTGIRPAFTLGYEFRLERNLGVTVNYSYFSRSLANVGVGIQVRGGPLQFYFMSDNILAAFNYFNAQTIHYRFGINLLFGDPEPKYRPTYFR